MQAWGGCFWKVKPGSNNFLLPLQIILKSVQIQTFFWSVFSRIRTEYGDLIRKLPYSVRMYSVRKNSAFGHFSRSLVLYQTNTWKRSIRQSNNLRSNKWRVEQNPRYGIFISKYLKDSSQTVQLFQTHAFKFQVIWLQSWI